MITNVFLASLIAIWAHCTSSLSIDQSDFKYTLNTTGTNTYAGAVNYGKTHPTRDGGSWSGWYNLLCFNRFNKFNPYPYKFKFTVWLL